jgi:hypothetical protein
VANLALAAFVVTLLAFWGVWWLVHLLAQYVLPNAAVARFAALVNVPRRHLESVTAWNARIVAAHERQERAQTEFIEVARWESTSERGGVWLLRRNHPAAIALLHARYPDGPTLEELVQLAGHS